jgi:hypothetical protein
MHDGHNMWWSPRSASVVVHTLPVPADAWIVVLVRIARLTPDHNM